MVATDAAKSSVLQTTAVVRYAGEVGPDGIPVIDMTITHPQSIERGWYQKDYSIALGELIAIREAILSITDNEALIILATDSMNAKNWVQSGKAHNSIALLILGEIFRHLRQYNQRLYVVYVPSAQNVADFATRDITCPVQDAFDRKQFEDTRTLLRQTQVEATGMWLERGGRTGGVEDKTKTQNKN